MAVLKVNLTPIHWPRIVNDLLHMGLTIKEIATTVGIDRNKIERMRRDGTCPRFDDGELVVEFWCLKTGKTRADVPRLSRYDWKY